MASLYDNNISLFTSTVHTLTVFYWQSSGCCLLMGEAVVFFLCGNQGRDGHSHLIQKTTHVMAFIQTGFR